MKTIIITGANGNLGTAVTKKFLDSGYRVVATVHDEAGKGEMPASANLEVTVANLANADESERFVQGVIAKYSQVHGALMLVGGFAGGGIKDTSSADIAKMFSLNFDTAYNVTRPLYTHMREKGYGRLVFIGARPALNAVDGKSAIGYGLSKSLLFKLAEYINAETKHTNVTATVVAASTLDTPPNRKSMPDVDPAKWVRPEQMADLLELVCSDKADPLRESVFKVYNNA